MPVEFKPYLQHYQQACLALFDLNCPEYFAPNERADYSTFLESGPSGYQVCLLENKLVGAFGLSAATEGTGELVWILLHPSVQGQGIGNQIMNQVEATASDLGINLILIGTSHKAFAFFEKRGAKVVSETADGWGPGMHRVNMELRL